MKPTSQMNAQEYATLRDRERIHEQLYDRMVNNDIDRRMRLHKIGERLTAISIPMMVVGVIITTLLFATTHTQAEFYAAEWKAWVVGLSGMLPGLILFIIATVMSS